MRTIKDVEFINNLDGSTASKIGERLKYAKTLDILVGYFNICGFYEISDYIPKDCKVRLLIGIEDTTRIKTQKDRPTVWLNSVKKDINANVDTQDSIRGIRRFMDYLEKKNVNVRVVKDEKVVHAKLYIIKGSSNCVISGSSNLTRAGLVENIEFNTLVSRQDDKADETFRRLWDNGIKVEGIENLLKDTWLDYDINATDLRIKSLCEYFKSELETHIYTDSFKQTANGIKELKYQTDATIQAIGILNTYNGVFLSDVVGLGKTNITCNILKAMNRSALILVKPKLINQWEITLDKYGLNNVKVISYRDYESYKRFSNKEIIVIDESHNFRNSDSDGYVRLAEITHGKKVILISATPQNNNIMDLRNQIALFTNTKNSNICIHHRNLGVYFKDRKKRLDAIKRKRDNCKNEQELLNVIQEYKDTFNFISDEIRRDILTNIMIRRTRHDIQQHYAYDLETQGVKIPEIAKPQYITYEMSEEDNNKFSSTLDLISKLQYTLYKSSLYGSDSTARSSRFVGVMRCSLMKAFDSSIIAFMSMVDNLSRRCKDAKDSLSSNGYFIIEKMEVDSDSEDGIVTKSKQKIRVYKHSLSDKFINDLDSDISVLDKMTQLWSSHKLTYKLDTKATSLIEGLKNDDILRRNKVVIFTESQVTCSYLHKYMCDSGLRAIKISGATSKLELQKVLNNFSGDGEEDDYDILVTTDILSEGINLQRASVILNYDIPWNPTKLMQRAGRINRIDTDFDKLYIYNMGMLAQTDKYINSQVNIVSKLESFKRALGDDMVYLDESVNDSVNGINTHGKGFGVKGIRTHELGTEARDYEPDDSDELSSSWFKEIQDIKINSFEYYNRIKRSPNKACTVVRDIKENVGVLNMVRRGGHCDFYFHSGVMSKKISLNEAMAKFKRYEGENSIGLTDDIVNTIIEARSYTLGKFSRETTDDTDYYDKYSETVLKYINYLTNDSTYELEDVEIDELLKCYKFIMSGCMNDSMLKPISEQINEIKKSDNYEDKRYGYVFIYREIIDKYMRNYVDTSSKHRKAEVVLSLCIIPEDEEYTI